MDKCIQAGDLTLVLNKQGNIVGLLSKDGVNYAQGEGVPLASLIKLVMASSQDGSKGPSREDGIEIKPIALSVNQNLLTFKFENAIEVDIEIREKKKYTVLEVTRVDKKNLNVELLMWGPITTCIKENFGETLGVAYNDCFAIGMRGLNDKTQLTAPFEYVGHKVDGKTRLNVSYPQDRSRFKGRVSALECCGASPTEWGSILQAFTYDSTKERIRNVNFVGEKRVPVLQNEDAEIVGSTIALYGKAFEHQTPRQAVLDTIETLEIEEALPHPLLEGEWQKITPKATRPYFILGDLSHQTIEKASQYANKANIDYVYKDSLFTSNGSYHFVGGDTAMKEMVDQAASYGVKVGSHSLSGFIDFSDAYTTKANKGQFSGEPLAKLTQAVAVGSNELVVTGEWKNRGATKQIGDELVEVLEDAIFEEGYKITLKKPLEQEHFAGEVIWGLHNNQYGGLGAGVEQTREIATRLAEACNHTGMSQISFDGVEIGEYNGYSHYCVNQMINQFYNQLSLKIQAGIISDSSGGYPNAWHTNTRQNWGEPWGLQMREGMIDYRYDNQLYFDRNFTPKMLGWFMYEDGQPTIDIEWMLAKSAGFDAGYALVTSVGILDKNGNSQEVLEAVCEWQKARECHAFTEDQKRRLLDTKKDWHLEKTEVENKWHLYCMHYPSKPVTKFYDGESETFEYLNPYHDQSLHFEIQAKNGEIKNVEVIIEEKSILFDTVIPSQGYLVYKGDELATIYDERWNKVGEDFAVLKDEILIKKGMQKVEFKFEAEHTAAQASLRVITQSDPEEVFAGNTVEKGPSEILEHKELGNDTNDSTQIQSVATTEVITYKGLMPIFPSKLHYVCKAGITRVGNVIWDNVPEEKVQEVGRFEVEGAIEGVACQAVAHVIVTDGPLARLIGSDTVDLQNTQVVTLTYGLAGIHQVSKQELSIYFDKEVFAFNKEGEGIAVIDKHTRVQSFNVNNESAIIDLTLESDPSLSNLEELLALTFTVKKEGIGKITLKKATLIQDQTQVEAIVTGTQILLKRDIYKSTL